MSTVDVYDAWLDDDGPVALVVREPLVSVEGADGTIFPATFAAGDTSPGGYNIDVYPDDKDISPAVAAMIRDGKIRATIEMFPAAPNVCLIDSVGSQANRIEPMFAREPYRALVPQVVISAGHQVNLLDAGHRAGDALVRCTGLQAELREAFLAIRRGDAGPLAKIAPTSLVFGVWDSRDTQAKLPRLVSSTIRAYNVRKQTRSAQFNPATEYVEHKLLDEPADKKQKDAYAERGFIHVPATGSHGGVVATGGVRRDATLSLAALRLLAVREAGGTISVNRTKDLRRYILGLSLTAFTAPFAGYLRQGCQLVIDPEKPREFKVVYPDGRRDESGLSHADAVAFASVAASAFGIGEDRTVAFEPDRARRDVTGESGDGPSSPPVRTSRGRGGRGRSQPTEGE